MRGRHSAWLPLRPCGVRSGIVGWLAERGSLTARLRAHCDAFSLNRLYQGMARPRLDEAGLLVQPLSQRAWTREVVLCADGVPVVYAHSVTRPDALRGSWRLLVTLGSRPVGDAVFTRALTCRSEIRVRRLAPRDALRRAACAYAGLPATTPLWARRSAFVYRGQALWVTEVFLPAVAALRGRRPLAHTQRLQLSAPSDASAAV
jgi:chorismate--pyruvate lyase